MAKTEEPKYRNHFVPLESNPDVFTSLIHSLGAARSIVFCDIWSLDDPQLLSNPPLALVLVFPTSETYESSKRTEEASHEVYAKSGDGEPVMWFRQTINNACGLYGILHAVSNSLDGDADFTPESHLRKLLQECKPLAPSARAQALEDDAVLEELYKVAALGGDTEAPENPEDEVDFHYVCFVRSRVDGHMYELDGDRKGPVDKGLCDEHGVSDSGLKDQTLGERYVQLVKEFMEREIGGDMNFSLLGLFREEVCFSGDKQSD